MASIRQLKSRIRSVKSTKQITKAMETVAASKMRKAQEFTRASAAYTEAANELLTFLAQQESTQDHPLFAHHTKIERRLLIVIASDKGLAGAYNSNVFKKYIQRLKADDEMGISNETIAVGSKTARFASRLKDNQVLAVYESISDRPQGRDLRVILDTAISSFEDGEVDAVDVIYTKFINPIRQEVTTQRILPAGYTVTEVSDNVQSAVFEPTQTEVLEEVAYRLIEAQLYQAMLDARASEHSMRMEAMRSATDNASDLIDDLTLEMNKERQAAITQELAEISGGVEAMKE